MRKLFVGALVGALALAITAIALGATQQTFKQKYSTNRTGKSVGTTFSTDSSDPANTAANNQPKSAREFDVTFPSGSKIDTAGATECKATDDELIQAGGKPACPKSVVGTGSAKVKLPFPGSADINAKVTALDAPKGLILYVDPSPVAQPIILHSKFKGTTLKTPVPPNCVPPATNQGGQCKKQDGTAGQEAILSHFDLKTSPKKKGKHVLIKSPAKCTGSWTFSAHLKYADGTATTLKSKQACKK